MGNKASLEDKPDLPRRLFWEFRYDDIEWRKEYLAVIERVLERGTPEERAEMVRFYGDARVIDILKRELKFFNDYTIEDACAFFPVRKEELLCYTRKQ